MAYNKLGFAFIGLKTNEFATIVPTHNKRGETNLMTQLSFGVDIEDHTIVCNSRFSFEKAKDQPFLILEIQAFFEIKQEDFDTKVKQDDNRFLITKGLAIHFAVLTVGSARGVLHAKTEGSIFNQYILPTINVMELIDEDIVVEL